MEAKPLVQGYSANGLWAHEAQEHVQKNNAEVRNGSGARQDNGILPATMKGSSTRLPTNSIVEL